MMSHEVLFTGEGLQERCESLAVTACERIYFATLRVRVQPLSFVPIIDEIQKAIYNKAKATGTCIPSIPHPYSNINPL